MGWIFDDTTSFTDQNDDANKLRAKYKTDQEEFSCKDWQNFYLDLVNYYSRNTAKTNTDILIAHSKAKKIIETDWQNLGIFTDLGHCRYDCEFVKFFTAFDFKDVKTDVIAQSKCGITDVVSSAAGAIQKTTSNISKTFDAVGRATEPKNFIKIGILAVAGFLIYKEVTKPKNRKRK